MAIELLTAIIVGAAFGTALAWLGLRSRYAGADVRLSLLEKDLAAARNEFTRQQEVNAQLREQTAALESTLQHERKSAAEKLDLLDRATEELREAFQALASDALKSNNQSFLQLAKTSLERFQSEAKGDLEARQKAVETLVAPIKESLDKVDTQIQQMEKDRSRAYGSLTEQVQSLIGTQKALQADDHVVPDVDDRLVEQLELPLHEPAPQIGFHVAMRLDHGNHFRLEPADSCLH